MNRFTCARVVIAMALAFGLTVCQAQAVHANSLQIKKTDPTYYRFMIGKFEVTALSDGTMPMPVDRLLTNTSSSRVERDLKASDVSMPFEMNFNAYLVNTGSKLVLIDAGAGNLLGPDLGKMSRALKAAGYTPDQVDEIYITHLHPDHVGGIEAKGKAVFPNAVVRLDKAEGDFWLNPANLKSASKEQRPFFEDAQAALAPYIDTGRYRPFDGASTLLPGITSKPLVGHTPGHTGYMIESDGQKLLVWGDVVHVGPIQFAEPGVTISFDVDSERAEKARLKVLADAAKRGYWIAAAHISFPGLGHVVNTGNGTYRWIPAQYVAIH